MDTMNIFDGSNGKFVIWGAGHMGARVLLLLRMYNKNVFAFIDSNRERVGTTYRGIRIISFEEYKKLYRECVVFISITTQNRDVVEILTKENMFFFNIIDYPISLLYYCHDSHPPIGELLKNKKVNLKGDGIGIYGINFWGLIIYDYISERKENVYLIDSVDKLNSFKRTNLSKRYNLKKVDEKECYSLLLNVKNEEIKEGVDFYNFSECDIFFNKSLSAFKDIYKLARRCFIVATGPSMTVEDLEILHRHKEICFSMNCIYKVFKETDWRPTAYFVADSVLLNSYANEILSLDIKLKFLANVSASFWGLYDSHQDIYKYSIIRESYSDERGFSNDITKGVFGASTIVYIILQFAIYMGFNEIYIIGMDGGYTTKDGRDDVNHFIPGYSKDFMGESIDYQLNHNKLSRDCMIARNYAEKLGVNIYNATRGGYVETLKRVNFDSLFMNRN